MPPGRKFSSNRQKLRGEKMLPALRFNAHYALTSQALRALLAQSRGRQVVVDLTQGSWVPQSFMTQFMGQVLGKELTFKNNAAQFNGSLGDAMSSGIDQDCKGNSALLEASTLAAQVARLHTENGVDLYLMVPCHGTPWRAADRLLIEYLATGSPSIRPTFIIAAKDRTEWPEGWEVTLEGDPISPDDKSAGDLLSILPGALSPALQKTLETAGQNSLLSLPNGWAVVTPEHRRHPAHGNWKPTPAQTQCLSSPLMRPFAAYLALLTAPATTDAWLFAAEAWTQFGSGYAELALQYVRTAMSLAKDEQQKILLQSHAQAMRIAMAAYQEAGSEEDPPADIDVVMRTLLLEMKGWGLVMGGSPKPALPLLREALRICKPSVIDKQYLFQMNITALAEVRCGNSAAALELELAIDSHIREHNIDDARLLFVNSLNLARLYRYMGDLEEAERLYKRAFSTVDGARTGTDSVNANLSLARIAEAKNDNRAALQHWLRGAFHWMAGDSPEALNWRVQGMLVSKGAAVDVKSISAAYDLVERLAAAFLDQLDKVSRLCGHHLDTAGVPLLRFELPFKTPGVTPVRVIGDEGWAVISCSGLAEPRRFGPHYDKLNRWLGAWLRRFAGDLRHDETCFWLDARDGSEMPVNSEQFLSSAAEFKLRKLTYAGENFILDTADLAELDQQRFARLNPIVSHVNESNGAITLSFRRYLKPLKLSSAEQAVFNALRLAGGSLSQARAWLEDQSVDTGQFEALVARLRAQHVFQIFRVSENVTLPRLRKRQLAAAAMPAPAEALLSPAAL